jgi:hypothetical protein
VTLFGVKSRVAALDFRICKFTVLLHEVASPLRRSFVFRCPSSIIVEVLGAISFAFRLALYIPYAHQILYYRTSTPKTWQRSWLPDLDAAKAKDSGTTPHTHCHYYSTRMRRSRRKFRKDSGSCRRRRNDDWRA